MEARAAASIEKLYEKARAIVDNTEECSTTNADENTWGTNVVYEALKWEYASPSFSRAENMQVLLASRLHKLANYNPQPIPAACQVMPSEIPGRVL